MAVPAAGLGSSLMFYLRGDIRNCLVALADAPTLMRDLFQFRFDGNSEFSGHSFGNLFLT